MKPTKNDGMQIDLRHPAVAVLILVAIVAFVLLVIIPAYQRSQDRAETNELVLKWTMRLANEKIESGEFRRHPGPALFHDITPLSDSTLIVLPTQDSWGHDLLAKYVRTEEEEIVTVVSKGPDGELDTADDIRHSASTGIRKAAKKFLKESAREAGKQGALGVMDAVKESIWGKPDEKKETKKP